MNDIIILGAGGFGREIAWTLERLNACAPRWHLIGFADDAPDKASGTCAGAPLLVPIAKAVARHPQAALALAVGDNAIRARLFAAFPDRTFPVLVDPSALCAPSAHVGAGTFIGPFALVSTDARLGTGVIVNARAGVGHDCLVDDFAQICPGATLSGHTHVGAGALVASNAATVPGVVIGARAAVAAGTPVFTKVAPGATLSPFGTFRRDA